MPLPDSLRLPAASAHEAEDEPSGAYPVGRAKTIARPRQAFSTEDLDAACAATATTTADLARAWGISDVRAAAVRKGVRPLTWEKIRALPASVKEALLVPHLPKHSAHDAKIESALVVVLELVRARRGGT